MKPLSPNQSRIAKRALRLTLITLTILLFDEAIARVWFNPPTTLSHWVLDKISRLAAAAAAALTILAITELAIRAIRPQPVSTLNLYGRHPRLPLYGLQPSAHSFISDGETDWTVQTDQTGTRIAAHVNDPDLDSDPRPLILAIGGTNPFGYGVNHEESYLGLLQTNRPELRVVNAAVPLFGPVQFRMILEDWLTHRPTPTLVLINICPGTDFGHVLLNKDRYPRQGIWPWRNDLKSILVRRSHLYRLLGRLYHHALPPADPPKARWERSYYDPNAWLRHPLDEAKRHASLEIGRILEIAHAHALPLAFILIPTSEMLAHTRAQSAHPDSPTSDLPTRHIREILDSHHALVLDTTKTVATLPPGTTHHRFDRHLTSQAHKRIADLLTIFLHKTLDFPPIDSLISTAADPAPATPHR